MNKIPQRLHPSKLEIEDNLDFTPRRLRMKKERNSEIQNTLDVRATRAEYSRRFLSLNYAIE